MPAERSIPSSSDGALSGLSAGLDASIGKPRSASTTRNPRPGAAILAKATKRRRPQSWGVGRFVEGGGSRAIATPVRQLPRAADHGDALAPPAAHPLRRTDK